MSRAVRNTVFSRSGSEARAWIEPCVAAYSMICWTSVSSVNCSRSAASKTGLTSTSFLPPSTCLVKARENSGSMPEEHPAMIEIVPVGAIVTTWAFRIGLPPCCVSQTLPFQAGKRATRFGQPLACGPAGFSDERADPFGQ